ncbi:glycoside hydrolase family 97 protein [Asticcacaulis sp. BYS171W]|uniref:Glycoside hydrolase family 97 protein n=1 Tax=Asticcacaulis aquaticus TaxID=2984212 RepID=A0ABT5HSR8_9CAUL|nr:glycoside hydrolase family 97 protein [Asticcacaulis aquaticus]MDC7683117.1 glycoside hydrolase family 97 protein [Asticcacaulis aquaticus]
MSTTTIGWVAPAVDIPTLDAEVTRDTGYAVVAEATSPGGVIRVRIGLDKEGRAAYMVDRKGRPVIAPSRLGFILTDHPKLDRHFALEAATTTTHDETWEQPWGEWQFRRDHHTELRVDLVQAKFENRRMSVVFRLFDDGVGFRYVFPDQAQLPVLNISDELTEFAVVDSATAFWNVAGEWSREEYIVQQTPLAEVSQSQTPMTVKTDSGLYIAFHEAALIDYAAAWLRRVDGQRLKVRLAPSSTGPSVTRPAPFATPWRTMIITDTAPDLYHSPLMLNLNEPNILGDVSWVEPFKYVGIWWDMHLGLKTWEAGPNHGATTEYTKRYIDFAAAHGFRGVLVEGWNLGWEDWFATGHLFDFVEAYPDFDLAEVAAYAREKGVRIVGHHETAGNAARYEAQMEAAFALYLQHGVDSVKTGYVADAGGAQLSAPDGTVYFTWNDSQDMVRHFQRVTETAAKYRIAVNTHEPIKDTGLRRTWPNWVSREGQRGMEYNCWGNPPNPPEHEVNLVFTRMLSGPMDFTPGILSLQGNGQPIYSTKAKQLALYVVLYSPIHMAADLIEHYERDMAAFQFIKDVPTDWSDTRMLSGEPGEHALIVRKTRGGRDWYLGAVTNAEARQVTVALDFLDPGAYEAQIYRDGDDADFRTETRHSLVIETRNVTAADSLTLYLAPGGGQAIRFRAL